MFSARLNKIINRDSYTKEWKEKTARCLFAWGASEVLIESAITGNLDNRRHCYNACTSEGLSFSRVWELLK